LLTIRWYLVKMVDNNTQEVEPPFRRAQSGSGWITICLTDNCISSCSDPITRHRLTIATFPSDYSGDETNRRSAGINHFDYDKSYRNYEDVRTADEIHQFTLVFQYKNKNTTGIAALKLKRKFVGIEDTLVIARHNISQTISSGYKRSGVT